MHHWKETHPGDPSAPQLTMYWGRLGSRPWYRISAGTCSTSSSPWCQERAENLIPGAATSTMEYEPKGRISPTPAQLPSPAKQTSQPCQKNWQDQVAPTPSPGSASHPFPFPHSLRRAGSAGTPLPCAPAPQQWTCTCAAGDRLGSPGSPALPPAPACSQHPAPSLPDPCPRDDLCGCAGWELLGSGLGQGQ